MNFRRGSHDGEIAFLHEEHIWRRIDRPDRSVEVEWRTCERDGETLGKNCLDYVASTNVFLRPFNHLLEFLLAEVALGNFYINDFLEISGLKFRWRVQKLHGFTDPRACSLIGLLGFFSYVGIGAEGQRLAGVIEDQYEVGNHEEQNRKFNLIFVGQSHARLYAVCILVGKVAYCPAGETGVGCGSQISDSFKFLFYNA